MYDIVIVGSGPAGLTAAVYARRSEKTVLVIEKETFGGQITYSPKVQNYPGTLQMSGNEFAEKLVEQALSLGTEIELDTVTKVENEGNFKKIYCENGTYEAKAVIIATGSKHRQLGIDREDELIGSGVCYCAVCDGAFFAGKDVAVIGGGNTALQDAVLLADICKSVTVVQNLAFFTGEQSLIRVLEGKSNVSFIVSSVAKEIKGDTEVNGLVITNTETGEDTLLSVNGIFVAIGQVPQNKPFENVAKINEYGYIEADEKCLTDTCGIFVAGDCRTKAVRQITTAVSDGAVAAVSACRYIDEL